MPAPGTRLLVMVIAEEGQNNNEKVPVINEARTSLMCISLAYSNGAITRSERARSLRHPGPDTVSPDDANIALQAIQVEVQFTRG